MSAEGTLWYIDAPHFCCGLVVQAGRVIEAAPIVGWAMGKPWREVRAYMRRKGWSGQPVPESRKPAEISGLSTSRRNDDLVGCA